MMASSVMYKGMTQRFHVHQDFTGTPGFKCLDAASKEGLVELEVDAFPYSGKSFMIKRICPMWDKDVQFFFPRDIDALPSSEEVRAVRVFMNKDALIHGIRGFRSHTIRIMGGLCGFRADALRHMIPSSFDDFLIEAWKTVKEMGHDGWQWNSDQEFLSRFFAKFESRILDTPLGDARVLEWHKAIKLDRSEYDGQSLEDIPKNVRATCDLTYQFPGAPIKFPDGLIHTFMAWNNPMSTFIRTFFRRNPDIGKEWGISHEAGLLNRRPE